ncbi:hypothetical protein H072_8596 [Dactylellina haptotyla CBS 200.50]|uniref:Uncharacterized protein n=1 Tax=Dactylellina haptotyla (strain CBS 200.50) TaxID=1284197 RepID=S8A9E0_DACHA|nr:hypothetical protein H072_8596 [Dactylellina haptotyla CBS 200.50]
MSGLRALRLPLRRCSSSHQTIRLLTVTPASPTPLKGRSKKAGSTPRKALLTQTAPTENSLASAPTQIDGSQLPEAGSLQDAETRTSNNKNPKKKVAKHNVKTSSPNERKSKAEKPQNEDHAPEEIQTSITESPLLLEDLFSRWKENTVKARQSDKRTSELLQKRAKLRQQKSDRDQIFEERGDKQGALGISQLTTTSKQKKKSKNVTEKVAFVDYDVVPWGYEHDKRQLEQETPNPDVTARELNDRLEEADEKDMELGSLDSTKTITASSISPVSGRIRSIPNSKLELEAPPVVRWRYDRPREEARNRAETASVELSDDAPSKGIPDPSQKEFAQRIQELADPGSENIHFSSVFWGNNKPVEFNMGDLPEAAKPHGQSDLFNILSGKESDSNRNPRETSASSLFNIFSKHSPDETSENLDTAKIFTQFAAEERKPDLFWRNLDDYQPQQKSFQADPIESETLANNRIPNPIFLLSALTSGRTKGNNFTRDEYQYSLDHLKLMRYGMDGMNISGLKERLQRTKLPFSFPAIRYDDIFPVFFPKPTTHIQPSTLHQFPVLELKHCPISTDLHLALSGKALSRDATYGDASTLTGHRNLFAEIMMASIVPWRKGYMRATAVPLDTEHRHVYAKQQTIYTVLDTITMVHLDIVNPPDPLVPPYKTRDLLAQLVADAFSCHFYNREILQRQCPVIGTLTHRDKLYISVYDPQSDTPYVSEPLDIGWSLADPNEKALQNQEIFFCQISNLVQACAFNGIAATALRVRGPTDMDTRADWVSTLVGAEKSLLASHLPQAVHSDSRRFVLKAMGISRGSAIHNFPKNFHFRNDRWLNHRETTYLDYAKRLVETDAYLKKLRGGATEINEAPYTTLMSNTPLNPPSSLDTESTSPTTGGKESIDKDLDQAQRMFDLLEYLSGEKARPGTPPRKDSRLDRSEQEDIVAVLNKKANMPKRDVRGLFGLDDEASVRRLLQAQTSSRRGKFPKPPPHPSRKHQEATTLTAEPEWPLLDTGDEHRQNSFFGDGEDDDNELFSNRGDDEDWGDEPLPLAPDPGSKTPFKGVNNEDITPLEDVVQRGAGKKKQPRTTTKEFHNKHKKKPSSYAKPAKSKSKQKPKKTQSDVPASVPAPEEFEYLFAKR